MTALSLARNVPFVINILDTNTLLRLPSFLPLELRLIVFHAPSLC